MGIDYTLHIFHSPKFRSVVGDAIRFFSITPAHRLPPSDKFSGGGVYGLYYSGNHELYDRIASLNRTDCNQPIYVGKAVPPGWRTARINVSDAASLYQRLREHARSVEQSANLRLEDFWCRFMILNDIEGDLVVPVEAELIRKYKPLWNAVVDGFGNHDPGSGRYNQAKSEWDVLHPGRPWAERLAGISPHHEQIIAKVRQHLESGLS